MLDKAMMEMMAQGIWETCYMTIVATFFGYVIGLPLGIALTLTDALDQTGALDFVQLGKQLHRLVTPAAEIVGNFFDCVINEHAPVLVVPAVFLG